MKLNNLIHAGSIGLSLVLGVNLQAAINLQLDFSNHAIGTVPDGTQPDLQIAGTGTVYDGQQGMLFTDVADFSSTGVGIDIVLETIGSTYSASNRANNGNSGSHAQINLAQGASTNMRLSLYKAGTLDLYDAGASDYDFKLAIFDIDGQLNGGDPNDPWETLTMLTAASYELTDTTTVAVSDGNKFSTSTTSQGNVLNPTSSDTNLNAAQEDHSVIFTFTNTNIVNFAISNMANSGRNFFIDGRDFTIFDDATSTGVNDGNVVPEPRSFACLAGLFVAGVVLTRRSRR